MAAVTRDSIKAALSAAPAIDFLDIPALGGTVYVRGLTGKQRDLWEQWIVAGEGKNRVLKNVRGKLLARTICDAQGKRLMEDTDADWIGDLSGAIVAPLYDLAAQLSGISEATKKDLERFSEAEGSGASSSDSPNGSAD
jgi:hypothetical protein